MKEPSEIAAKKAAAELAQASEVLPEGVVKDKAQGTYNVSAAQASEAWTVRPNGKNSHSIVYIKPEFKNVTELVAAHNTSIRAAQGSELWRVGHTVIGGDKVPAILQGKKVIFEFHFPILESKQIKPIVDAHNASIRAAAQGSESSFNEPDRLDERPNP